MKLKLFSRSIIFILFVGFLFTMPIYIMSLDESDDDNEVIYLDDPPKGMVLVSETNDLQLYFDFYSTAFEVIDKKTNNLWTGSPVDRKNDPIANRRYKGVMSSNVLVNYVDEGGEKFLNSFTNSVEFDQFEVGIIKNGARIEYLISDSVLDEVSIPLVLPYSIMHETILPFLNEKDQREFLSNYEKLTVEGIKKNNIYRMQMVRMYPFIADEDVYAMIGMYSNPLNKAIIKGLLEKAGVDTDEIIAINEKYYDHTSVKKNPTFRVTVEITIEEDILRASVDMSKIEFDSFDAELKGITLLPYFGAAEKEMQGYALIPDGPGALVNLNDTNKETYSPLILPVYGGSSLASGTWDSVLRQQVSIPAFGMAYDSKGFVAVIEEGDAVSSIEVGLAGLNTNYSYVNAQFNYNDFYMIDNPMSLTRSPEMSKVPYKGIASVVYMFLDEKSTDYIGMAIKTREFYEKTGVLSDKKTKSQAPLSIEVPGAVTVTKKFLGITYNSQEALTSYYDTADIIRLFGDNGIGEINIRMMGWTSGGSYQKYPVGSFSNRSLGGEKGLHSLIKIIDEYGYDFYPDYIFTRVYPGIITAVFKSARDIKGSPWIIYDNNPVIYGANPNSPKSYLLRQDEWAAEVDFINSHINNLGISKISVSDLGYMIYPDYRKSGNNRQNALEAAVSAAQDLRNYDMGLMGLYGSIKVVDMYDIITDIALYSSGHIITDKTVPFYQTVIRGYTNYYGTPVNKENDGWHHILKSVEYGAAGIKYLLTNTDNTKIWELGWNDLRNTFYKDRMDEITANYFKISEYNEKTANAAITGHEEIVKGLFMTKYDNGVTVYVNYNDYEISESGMIIDGMSFQIREE